MGKRPKKYTNLRSVIFFLKGGITELFFTYESIWMILSKFIHFSTSYMTGMCHVLFHTNIKRLKKAFSHPSKNLLCGYT